jgi:D-sedoheptulose 7-phosphate isomerase
MEFYRQYATEINETLDHILWHDVQRVVDVLHQAWLANRQVFIMGNGGSASTASHLACDLGKNASVPGLPRLRALSLNDNMALFSAYANDNRYENVFVEQLGNFIGPGDVVLAISASGNSPNVLNGIEMAHARGAITIGWSGYHGGKLAQMVDIAIVVPNHDIQQIEDIHLMLGHMVTVSLQQAMRAHPPAHSLALEGAPAYHQNGAVSS